MSAALEIHIANSVNMHAANYHHLKQKATPETGGKNWKLKRFVVSLAVVRNTSLSFTTATKTENEKSGTSKYSNNENIRETSAPAIHLLRGSHTDSSCHSVSTGFLVWGVISVLVWWWFGLVFKGASWFYLNQQQHRTAPHQNIAHSAGTAPAFITAPEPCLTRQC